jgi:hypothetical protein
MPTGKYINEKEKKQIAKRALELKKECSYLSWGDIAERIPKVYDSSHLRKIVRDYKDSED